MPYESMPDLPELLREAAVSSPDLLLLDLESVHPKMPATVPARVARSAAVMACLCEIFDVQDPEAAFRDALRELQHAAVEFGMDWTAEERQGWREVQDERAQLGCPGAYRAPY